MENVEMDELAVILLMFANLWRARNLAIADRRRPRSYWVHPIFQRERRRGVGEFHTLYHKLRRHGSNWILQEKRSSPKRHSQEKEQKKLDTKMTIRKHAKNTTTKTCKRKQVVSTASRTIISWRNNDSHAKSMQIRS